MTCALACSLLLAAAPARAAETTAAPPPAVTSSPAANPELGYGKIYTAAATGGLYLGLGTWLTLAWWSDSGDEVSFHTRSEGWFGKDSYAGGADKLGHAWINYALVRGVHGMLVHGGWDDRGSMLVSGGLSFAFWAASEVKDGYYGAYGFSTEDMLSNLSGIALGVAFEAWPELDRRLDFRLEYLPSGAFIDAVNENGPFNVPEDYDGQTYLLCYHLASHEFSQNTDYLAWTRYVDLTAGFNALHYKPIPEMDDARRQQNLFLGISLNLQPLLDGTTSGGGRALRFLTEVYQVPYTTLRVGSLDRSAPQPVE
jgi:hypothetical protein